MLEYPRADGSVWRELRPESEVFAPESLASLALAPVTDLHPAEMIGPNNARQFAVGVCAAPRRDGNFVAAELTIQPADVIAKVDSGDRAEISCGYSCDLDKTPGVYQGQHYDAIQRNIQYNHVALGPRGWGRAGADVCMRLDAKDVGPVPLVSRFDDDDVVDDTRDNPTTHTYVVTTR